MLTDDDKGWFEGLLGEQSDRIQGRFEKRIQGVETRFQEQIQGVETRLREQIQGFETRFQEQIQGVETRFQEQIQGAEARFDARLDERLEKLETTLLTEFHKWASPIDMRQRTHSATLRAVDVELESLNDRVKNVEGR